MLVVFNVALSLTDAVRHQFSYSHKKHKRDWKETEMKQTIKEFFLLYVADEIRGFSMFTAKSAVFNFQCRHVGPHCRMPTWIQRAGIYTSFNSHVTLYFFPITQLNIYLSTDLQGF